MNEDFYDGDFDETELSDDVLAQLERLELSRNHRAAEQTRMRRQKLKIRRELEDWQMTRKLRDDIDYMDHIG